MGNFLKNISGIPISKNPPVWNSSSPDPSSILLNIKDNGQYVCNERFSSFLKGKKVVYVCPSPHLKGLSMGDFIDSHDIVIRVNQSFDIPESHWKDYGKRTDCLMGCLNIHQRNDLIKNINFFKSLKFITCPMLNGNTLNNVNSFLEQSNIPFYNVDENYLQIICQQIGTVANTGLLGLITLLNYDVQSVYLTGMSFYNMNSLGDLNAMKKNVSINDIRLDIHKQQPQIDYFSKILKAHYPQKIKVDDYLIKNFNLKHLKNT